MNKHYNIKVGDTFGFLTVKELGYHKGVKTASLCKCECGKEVVVMNCSLVRGLTRSCGCKSRSMSVVARRKIAKLEIGSRFYNLKVIGHKVIGKTLYSVCECVCGNVILVKPNMLKRGIRVSCGCNSRIRSNPNPISNSKLYRVWIQMRERCNNPKSCNYENYGARGVRVCDEWSDSRSFIEWALSHGYKDGLSIDRIDVNGDYCPDNCKWSTRQEQNYNRRPTLWVEFNGRKMCLAEAAKLSGIRYGKLKWRFHHGWSGDKLFHGAKRVVPGKRHAEKETK